MSDVEQHATRLRRRGEFRLLPSTRKVNEWTEYGDEGSITTHSQFGDCWAIVWWPTGQGPGRHEGLANPFCQRRFEGDTIEEVFQAAFDGTSPPRQSIDDTAWHRQRERHRSAVDSGRAEVAAEMETSGSRGSDQ